LGVEFVLLIAALFYLAGQSSVALES